MNEHQRIIVTGGAGYVGSRVSAHLFEAGMKTTVLDKLFYGGEGLLSLLDHPNFRLIVSDIRDEQKVREALKDADAVVHMAALVGEPACEVDPSATLSINSEGTQNLVKWSVEEGVGRFLFLSTCSNYGISDAGVLANEDTPLNPQSLYAESKTLGEKSVLEAADHRFASCVLRLGTICGLSPRMRFNLMVNEMARSVVLGKEISIYGPSAWRPFLHIRDAARAIRHCLAVPSKDIRRKIFNVVGENCQKRQLVRLLLKHFPEARVSTKEDQDDPRDYRVSSERIEKELRFHPNHSVEQAFLEITEALRDGVFSDPFRPLYEALPTHVSLKHNAI